MIPLIPDTRGCFTASTGAAVTAAPDSSTALAVNLQEMHP